MAGAKTTGSLQKITLGKTNYSKVHQRESKRTARTLVKENKRIATSIALIK